MKKYLLTFLAGFVAGIIIITYFTGNDALAKSDNGIEQKEFVSCDNIQSDEEKILPEKIEEPSDQRESMLIDAPYIYQMDEYPNGCESVSAVMALQYLGIEIDTDRFINDYLPMGPRPVVGGIGPDPSLVYCGDPRSPYGWGCYSSVIASALDSMGCDYRHSYTDTLEQLCRKYIDKGMPVLVWATVGMENSQGNNARWFTNEGKMIEYNKRLHCLLLVGYDEESYYFNDPMVSKAVAYNKDICETAFEILGRQSICIIR